MVWELLIALALQFAPSPQEPAAPVASIMDSVEVSGFGPQHAGFEVSFGELRSEHRLMAMFALPGESVPIAVRAPAAQYQLNPAAGSTTASGMNRWTWTAPLTPGLYPMEVRDTVSGASMTLNVFVMVPYAEMRRGSLNGYRIGAYPKPRLGREAEYQRPRGFVEVTPALLETPVSPHFRLGQFVCKQAGGSRQYLVLRQPLLVKLEHLLAAVNQRGIEAPTFSIMSAYRTPHYNRAIGNTTSFSRHSYGDAADVFVDRDGDGVMDDLNRDGRHTVADVRVLSAILDEIAGDPEFAGLEGGLGTYRPNAAHGPFMHVDVRGFSVEWDT